MHQLLILLFAVLGCARAVKIAIVGGGIGAASTALHLRDLIADDLDIDVYEQSDHIGGRAFSLDIEGHTVEMGASILHEENHLIKKMAKISNLTLTAPHGTSETAGGDDLFALFDGTSLVFRQSPWRIITFIKLLWRYGLQPWQYKITASEFLRQFENIYTLQRNGTAFTRPHELLKKLDFFWLTQMSFVQYIHDFLHSYSNFASEFVSASSLVNYNQKNIQLNALAGLVSLLPAVDPRLYSIKEGNQKLAEGTFAAAGANVHLNSPVVEIAAVADENDNIKYKVRVSQGDTSAILYDAVIIATPFQNAASGGAGGDNFLNVTGVKLPIIPRREYQKTVVTIVKGAIRPTFFGLPPGAMPYNSILVTEQGSSVPFNSISKVASTSGFKGLYKIFSKTPITETWLSMLFDGGYEIAANQVWMGAYPAFDPPENFPPFQLSPGLYYANAWENAASAMEMAALAGRNVALLTAHYFSSSIERQRIVDIEYNSNNVITSDNDVELYITGAAGAAAAA